MGVPPDRSRHPQRSNFLPGEEEPSPRRKALLDWYERSGEILDGSDTTHTTGMHSTTGEDEGPGQDAFGISRGYAARLVRPDHPNWRLRG